MSAPAPAGPAPRGPDCARSYLFGADGAYVVADRVAARSFSLPSAPRLVEPSPTGGRTDVVEPSPRRSQDLLEARVPAPARIPYPPLNRHPRHSSARARLAGASCQVDPALVRDSQALKAPGLISPDGVRSASTHEQCPFARVPERTPQAAPTETATCSILVP